MNQRVFRYTKANCPALGILQHFGHFASRRQYEGVWPGSKRFDQAIGPVINTRVQADLGQIRAYQGEIVLLVGTPNSANSVDGFPVADMTTEGVAGVRRIRHEPTALNDAHDRSDPMRLRVCGVHFDEFSHARIVGEQGLRGYPCNTLLFATKLAARSTQ